MNLTDVNTINRLLGANGFSFKKSLGQNFLINPQVCPQMAAFAADSETGVLEIGPGIGVLTAELSKTAKKVIAVELDERLRKILPLTLENCCNVDVVYGDAMKMNLRGLIEESFSDCKCVSVCANLPYYITSPLIMRLLEERLPIDNITVMVQKEAAERLCAEVSSRQAGAVTVAVAYYAEAEVLFDVCRESFIPAPKVDSAVIQLRVRKTPPVTVENEKKFFALIKACFAQRRKTLLNTVSSTLGIEKASIAECLKEMSLEPAVRAEKLTLEQLAELSNKLSEKQIY